MKNVNWLRSLRNLLLAAIAANMAFLLYRIFNGSAPTGYGYQHNIERLIQLTIVAIPVLVLTRLSWLQLLLLVVVVPFLHYTLPQRDIVQIINTYNKNTPIGANWMFYSIEDTGTGVETTSTIRDIRFIDAVYPDGESVMVYRNEDTGWFWPPYFKWDSSTLQAKAQNLKSDKASPQWVAITHYGWRMPIFSIFPNAVSVNPVSGPDVWLIPWVNIIILSMLGFLYVMARMMLAQFRERMIDPAVDRMAQTLDAVDARADAARDRASGVWGRFMAWLGTWRGRPRP